MGKPEDYLQKAKQLLKQGRYDEALKYFDSALELNAEDVWAWIRRGDALAKLQRYNEALKSYDKAIEISPKEGVFWYGRGEVLSEIERFKEALESYNNAIKLNPKWYLPWIGKGGTLSELGKFKEALESYNKATEAAPDNGLPFLVMGQFQATQNRLTDALANLQKSLELFKAEKNADGMRIAKSWAEDLEKRIEEQKAKKEPPIEERIIRTIREHLQKSPDEDPLTRIREREERHDRYFEKPRTINSATNFLIVLRRWNSFTPKIPNRGVEKRGGGYFLVWKGKGIVIDPGFDFMDNFDGEGYSIRDIDAIILTHAHTDHTADLESMLNLLYELSDRAGSEYNVDLFMNIGTVNKFIGWVSRLKGVGNKVSLNAGDSIKPKGYDWVLNVKSARHHEIIGDDAVGLVLELYEGSKVALKLGFTGDTGWSSSIQNQYRGCKLLVLHLGSIGPSEFNEKLSLKSKRRRYDGHLGLIGSISMVKSIKPKLAIISEFGEELGTDRCQIAQCIDQAFGPTTRCVTGDIGLKIRLPDLAVHCNLCKDYKKCEDVREMSIKAREQMIYCCSSHTFQDVIDKLVV